MDQSGKKKESGYIHSEQIRKDYDFIFFRYSVGLIPVSLRNAS